MRHSSHEAKPSEPCPVCGADQRGKPWYVGNAVPGGYQAVCWDCRSLNVTPEFPIADLFEPTSLTPVVQDLVFDFDGLASDIKRIEAKRQQKHARRQAAPWYRRHAHTQEPR